MIKECAKGLIVNFKIIPNSSKNDLILGEDLIKIKLTAQPVENKANKALIQYLSKLLKIPKSNIEIIRGETSKEKTVLFSTTDSDKKSFIMSQLTK